VRGSGESCVPLRERRYVVCRNLIEAKRDAEVCEGVLRSLREGLRRGDKTLIGNSAYRRYLKTPDEKHFEIDEKRVAEDARYDGLYVLRTNMRLDALAVMLRYRDLLKVEDIFRTTKSILDTRPIYHQTDAAIRGHVFCSFLALVMRKALEDHFAAARLKPEWGKLIRELDRLQEIETEQDGKQFLCALLSPATSAASSRPSASRCRPISATPLKPRRIASSLYTCSARPALARISVCRRTTLFSMVLKLGLTLRKPTVGHVRHVPFPAPHSGLRSMSGGATHMAIDLTPTGADSRKGGDHPVAVRKIHRRAVVVELTA
jgi:hypothetical protein